MNDLFKNGFVIVPNLLSSDEVEKFSRSIRKICGNKKKNRIDDLYNFEETWEYITNQKLLSTLESLIKEKVYYMNDSGISHMEESFEGLDRNQTSWHRDTDSAPRIEGVVPYYDKSQFYKVFSAITYVSPNNEGGTLNVIPKSHKKNFRYSFLNFLRLIHWRTKNKKNFYFFRNLIENTIGKKFHLRSGDCMIFFTTLFHKPEISKGLRQAIISRYAPKSENSESYINYVLKQSSNDERTGYKIDENNKYKIEKFFDILKRASLLPEL